MRLHVLGCHGPWPAADGATSGYLLEDGQTRVLMDCGSGVLGRLMRKADPAFLDAVLLSHLHFDHASDLTVLRYYLDAVKKELPLYLPGEDLSPLRGILEQSAYQVRAFPDQMRIGSLDVRTLPVRHPVPCRAVRVTSGGKTLVYTGDTNECPGLAEFAAEADALLSDAAFLESEWTAEKPHLSAKRAGELAARAGAKQLYLTHLPTGHDPSALEREARAAFPEARAVCPGMVIDL